MSAISHILDKFDKHQSITKQDYLAAQKEFDKLVEFCQSNMKFCAGLTKAVRHGANGNQAILDSVDIIEDNLARVSVLLEDLK